MAKGIFKIIADENHPIFEEGWTITTHNHIPIETRKRWLKEKEMLEENSNAQDS
jgi:hypothetical protein